MRKTVALLLALFLTASCLMAAKPAFSTTDTAENTWATKASMHVARSKLGVAVVKGKIYAIGGTTIRIKESIRISGGVVGINEEYDPATDTWTNRTPMPTPRASFAVAVYQNEIYCIGGTVSGELDQNTGVNEVYDPVTDTWTTKSSMPTPKSKPQANVVNGKIYLLGSKDETTFNQVYDPERDSWTTKASIPNAPYLFGSAVVDDKIYSIVEFHNTTGFNSKIEIYNPLTDNWGSGAIGRHDFSSVAAATTGMMAPKNIYVLSGWETMATSGRTGSQPLGNPTESNQIYNPKNDSWRLGAAKPTDRINFGVAVVNDTLYVIGGIVMRYPITFGWGIYDCTPTAVNEAYTPVGYGTIPPVIDVVSPRSQTYNESSVSLVFTVNKPINWTGYSLDGQETVTITGNATLEGLANGSHNVTVYARDAFGNTGASETVSFTVDVSFPATMVVAPVVAVAVVGAGLAFYYKKHKR